MNFLNDHICFCSLFIFDAIGLWHYRFQIYRFWNLYLYVRHYFHTRIIVSSHHYKTWPCLSDLPPSIFLLLVTTVCSYILVTSFLFLFSPLEVILTSWYAEIEFGSYTCSIYALPLKTFPWLLALLLSLPNASEIIWYWFSCQVNFI